MWIATKKEIKELSAGKVENHEYVNVIGKER